MTDLAVGQVWLTRVGEQVTITTELEDYGGGGRFYGDNGFIYRNHCSSNSGNTKHIFSGLSEESADLVELVGYQIGRITFPKELVNDDDIITVRVYVSTRYVGSKDYIDLKYDRETYEAMSDEEKEQDRLDAMWQMIDCWEEVL